uniref:Protein bicaudal C homolog 1-like n=1 Tax=Phallusia mammillata TaxID=59560 RepID=A0A6F9D706_9ASCI|nr:protein bicaudal C homolog 1-like [Phallusia mammillata]
MPAESIEHVEKDSGEEMKESNPSIPEVTSNIVINVHPVEPSQDPVNENLETQVDVNENVENIQKSTEEILQTDNETLPENTAAQTDVPTVTKIQKRPPSEESKEEDDPSTNGKDDVVVDPELTEERFRVDRRKLEQMLQAATDGKGQTGEEFFNAIMAQTNTEITWPSKLKIGAKSKKDPHIKVSGKQADVMKAKDLTMRVLDTKCTRVTLKMDVSHTEHSHVIGKGGNNIRRVMEETGCHIHFPDSNRNSTAEKSNQVSIAGQPAGVESAREKIRVLLPIVVTFDLAMSGVIPDPNSAPIQQIVQMYNISVQFKQRAKAYYTTTCTVRGSNDNISGLVEGTLKLMQHLTGATLHVTSQMEVAPQQHSYMLGRNAANVNYIMQRTGAQIKFPDPNALPKKSTIFVSGPVESVVMARQRLMGCLPLVLMFDMKQDESQSASDEAAKNSQLMESLDVFISIKLKPKQPSKSVIVKSVERNIYSMFEARRQLLKLNTTGLKSPPPSASPPPLTLPSGGSMNSATPIIRLTHAPSPNTIKPHYFSIVPPNGVAIGGIPRPATPNSWAHSPMPSPSQSPYPMSQQATVAAIHAQQQHNMIMQLNAQAAAQALASANASRASSIAGSPPSSQQKVEQQEEQEPSLLQVTQHFIESNARVARQQQQQQESNTEGWEGNSPPSNSKLYSVNQEEARIPSDVLNIQRHVMKVQKQQRNGGNISAGNSFNKGNTGKGLPHRHSMSTLPLNKRDESMPQTQRHSLAEGMDIVNKVYLQMPNGSRSRVPMSTPPGSDRNSPMSTLSERMGDVRVPSPEGGSKMLPMHLSPSSSASSADLHVAFRHLNSPNRGAYLHPDRAKERVPASDGVKNSYMNPQESSSDAELRELSEYYSQQDPSRVPPPGFENFPMSAHSPLTESEYENWRQKAYQAMRNQPVASEVRTPTATWAGLYFSRSMPVREMKKLMEKDKYRQQLATTYEGEDGARHEEGEVPEVNHLAMSQNVADSSRGSSRLSSWRERQNLSHSLHSKVGDLSEAIPKRKQHSTFDPYPNEYLNRNLPTPPHPNDDPSPPPQYREPEVSGRTPTGEPPLGRMQNPVIKNQPLEAALSLLTDNHLGGPNCVDLHELLKHLNLEKYSEVFANQEVDLQTFLTLNESDLTELGITVFGPRKKILLAIEELKKNRNLLYGNALNAAPGAPPLGRNQSLHPQPTPNVLLPPNKNLLGGLLERGSSGGESPTPGAGRSRVRDNPSHGTLSSSRLLSNASQSGRW